MDLTRKSRRELALGRLGPGVPSPLSRLGLSLFLPHSSTFLCMNSLSVRSFPHLLPSAIFPVSHPKERAFLIPVIQAKTQGYVSLACNRSHDYSQANHCAMKTKALINQTCIVYPLQEVEKGIKKVHQSFKLKKK